MSRGFVREGDQEEDPIIAPRAPLPEGVPNHVTPEGMQLLLAEENQLENEKAKLQADSTSEYRLEIRVADIKLAQLRERLRSAQVVERGDETLEEVRFGSLVTYRTGNQLASHRFRIVGVDEADVKEGKIAFTAPIAKALIGMCVGEERSFKLGSEERVIRVEAIEG